MFGCRCYLLNDYEDVGKLKAKGDIGVFIGYSKESAVFRIYNKQTRKIHESLNVNFDEISEMASKQFSLEPGLSNLNETGKSSNPPVSKVDEASKNDLEDLFQDFYDEYFDSSKVMKSSTTNVETPINEEVFHESISINMVPNGDEASTSHNVFNERLKDAYFDANTSFHDPSNVHIFYQPYPHEKKWTKDHPLYKITGDPKSSLKLHKSIQNYVSISTAESEYVAVSSCCAQVLWMRTQLTDYGFFYDKHMTGNHALLTNFVEKFLGTVRSGNDDFAMIAGYGDVGLKVAFRKSICFARNEDGVDLLTGDHSSNLYTIALNKVASNSSTCLLAKASSLQSWLWHQRLSHLNFATINNLVKNNLVQ
nr:hypothetical protein [Tanacetum cinerariifolium]